MPDLTYWEIPSTDVPKTSEFLAELFGWTMTPSTGDYMMFHTESGAPGGIEKCDEAPPRGVRVYVHVDDIPATLADVERLGGEVVQAKTEIGGDHGYWGAFRAPGGCWLGIWSKS